jgi:hypothetical protein
MVLGLQLTLGMKHLISSLILLFLITSHAFGGVDVLDNSKPKTDLQKESVCDEYIRLFRLISKEIVEVEKIRDNLSFLKPQVITDNAARLQCGFSDQAKRTAWSIPAHTLLNMQEWTSLSILDKLRLIVHEIAVMAGLENDGQYFRSEKIASLLKLHSEKYIDLMSSETILRRGNQITYVNPFVIFQGKRFPVGYQMIIDEDHVYAPETKEERKGHYILGRQSIPNTIDLAEEFCKLQGLKYSSWRIHNYLEYALKQQNKVDPPVQIVPPDFKIAWIQNGVIQIQDQLMTRARGAVLYLQTVTCEKVESDK